MRTVATIEARMGSTRLPGKVLKPAAGRPLLAHMIGRLERCPELDQIVVATTTNPRDDPISALARSMNIACVRGSEQDVLCRVLAAAQLCRAELVVRTTADCPLIDPAVVSRVIAAFHQDPPVDYCSNFLEPRTYPDGMDVDVLPLRVLARADQLATKAKDREHVTSYIYRHPERFRLRAVTLDPPHGDVRMTVDTPEDLKSVRWIFEELGEGCGLADILGLLCAVG
jgi:spore coat polysaccharide biosynthesis protein SpsF